MLIDAPDLVRDRTAVATFDFDNTMTLPVYNRKKKRWDHSSEPNPIILEDMFRYACAGWAIYVLVDRPKTIGDRATVSGFIRKHDIPVTGTIYCNGWDKIDFIKSAKAIVHYDDEIADLERLPEGTVGIRVPHPEDSETDNYLLASCTRMLADAVQMSCDGMT